MIKIYLPKNFSNDLLVLLEDEKYWNYPLEEIDYLIEERPNESFIYINGRLKETNGLCLEQYFIKEE